MSKPIRQRAAGTVAGQDRPPLADPMIYLVVFLGGCLGTGMRYGLTLANSPATIVGAQPSVWDAIHLGTFTANIVACFVYASLSTYVSRAAWVRKRSRDLVSRGFGMGMCGGLSTMSTLAFEQLRDLAAGNVFGVLVYVLLSFGVGVVAAYGGVRMSLAITRVRADHMASSVWDGMAASAPAASSSSSSSVSVDETDRDSSNDVKGGAR
ncbi:CrcB family protein [Bifidobacterium callimiconis]|uniref:FluC/FEX family fluoride channel n=1 Tax=Bifidobacterium callimiconis TaxID=2306973 RepID=UPI001BDD20F9|nr:CrcB family protein [Bifidobacterium callimiconis]MBT1176986.1 CrcB family protein [Bifidobacterium callimiconis]